MDQENDHGSHFSFGTLIAHFAIMALVMVPSMAVGLPPTVEPNLINSLAAGFNGAVNMMVIDPISNLPDFVDTVTWDGGLSYEWGSVAHHGGAEMAAHSAEIAAHGATDMAHLGTSFTQWLGGLEASGATGAVMEDCGSDMLSCFQDEYYHPAGH